MNAFLLLLLTAHASTAFGRASWEEVSWSEEHGMAVVKVESRFGEKGVSKLEGSGLIFEGPREGKSHETFYILTSEHVVLPENRPAEDLHYITTFNEATYSARHIESNWELGLSLLEARYSKGAESIHQNHHLPKLATMPGAEEIDPKLVPDYSHLEAWGFPAGSTRAVRASGGRGIGLLPAGSVLAGVPVIAAQNLVSEFGMSGGPVFYENTLFGLLTHITFEANSKTFLIPAATALAWAKKVVAHRERKRDWDAPEVDPGTRSVFTRSLEDFQYMFFSKDRAEIVRVGTDGLTLEKRRGAFLVSMPGEFKPLPENAYPGLAKIYQQMQERKIRVARVKGVAGQNLSASNTLAQFVGLLAKPDAQIDFEDYAKGRR